MLNYIFFQWPWIWVYVQNMCMNTNTCAIGLHIYDLPGVCAYYHVCTPLCASLCVCVWVYIHVCLFSDTQSGHTQCQFPCRSISMVSTHSVSLGLADRGAQHSFIDRHTGWCLIRFINVYGHICSGKTSIFLKPLSIGSF